LVFTDLTLARRLEAGDAANGAAFVRMLARRRPESGAAVEAIAGGFATYGGAESPLNQAVGLGMSGRVAAAEIDRLEAFFRERAAPARIIACPHADGDFVVELGRRGFRVVEFEDMLFRVLEASERFAPPPTGIEIRRSEARDADEWIRVMTSGFFPDDDPPASLVDVFRAGFDVDSNEFWCATADGRMAAAGGMAIRDGLASLIGSSTLVESRNLGIQTALLGARLARAIAAGCDLATISTKPGTTSQRNAQRAGFRVAYTRAAFSKGWNA
jgi:hypothetical protein